MNKTKLNVTIDTSYNKITEEHIRTISVIVNKQAYSYQMLYNVPFENKLLQESLENLLQFVYDEGVKNGGKR